MEINPITVVAQIVNFVLLVWVLRRVLYGPITNMIARREEAVNNRLQEAETMKSEAQATIAQYEQMRAALQRTRDDYLREARSEADRHKERLLADIAEEADAQRRRLAALFESEQRELRETFERDLISQVCRVSGELVREVTGKTLEDGLIDAFERALRREGLKLVAEAAPPVTVKLSFEPDEDQRARLATLIAEHLKVELGNGDVHFAVDPNLLLGLEIDYNSSVMTWSAATHLRELQREALDIAQRSSMTVLKGGGSDA